MLPGREERISTTERANDRPLSTAIVSARYADAGKEKAKTVEMTPNPTPTGAVFGLYDKRNGNLVRCRDNNLISDHNEVPSARRANFYPRGKSPRIAIN